MTEAPESSATRSAAPGATPPAALDCDVLIVGAGPVGMALARALADSPLRVLLIDARAADAWADDPRALALSYGSRQLLDRLGAWNASAATPIEQIHVSQRGGFGRTLLRAADYGIDALGYVMRYRDLCAALAASCSRTAGGTRRLDACIVENLEEQAQAVALTLRQHEVTLHARARLVVHAEGAPRHAAGVSVRDYRQQAIIAEIEPAAAHGGRAWERFTPDGPLALLPLEKNYALVFTVAAEQAPELLALDDRDFLDALRRRLGGRVDFVASGPRAHFPLALRVREPIARRRQAWIGNSAQTLHPVTGQGFNLGLRDAVELARTLLAAPADQAGDPGDATVLAAYARARRADRRFGIGFTDGVVHLFSNDLLPLRQARGLGLLALDLAPPLRHFIARHMIWGARA